jgi:hypothetical protein
MKSSTDRWPRMKERDENGDVVIRCKTPGCVEYMSWWTVNDLCTKCNIKAKEAEKDDKRWTHY